ncbi:MAG: hypothetical protein DRQ01_09560 [Ignavibacteriae bacterium]|nr:MAG: hypothetical protein DRQ01_09560 [Ignavibacteriota bacterium]
MNGKKFLMALVGGFLVMWLLSGLWHVLIMGDFYAKYAGPSTFEEPKMLFIALGYAILALLMVYIYTQGYKGGSPLKEGLRFGVIMGLLWVLPINVVMYGVVETSSTILVVDVIWHLVEQGIGGIVIGLIYGSKKSGEETNS